jgi:hypothetical protein
MTANDLPQIPAEIEPRNDLERELAMVYCRVNCWTLPISGARLKLTREERDAYVGSIDINNLKRLIDPRMCQWMWMRPQLWQTPEALREADEALAAALAKAGVPS